MRVRAVCLLVGGLGAEKPPPEWGGVCELTEDLWRALRWEKPPPQWGGACECA